MNKTTITIEGDFIKLQKAYEILSTLGKEVIQTFVDTFPGFEEFAHIHSDFSTASGTNNQVVVFEPSERFIEFLRANGASEIELKIFGEFNSHCGTSI